MIPDGAATIISIDGRVVPAAMAMISVLDRGLLYGDGCFEVLRTWAGVPRELELHLDRLADTAEFLRLRTPPREALVAQVREALAAARVGGQGERRIRILLTRGPGALGAPVTTLGPGRSIVIVEPLPVQPTELSAVVIDYPLPARMHRGHKLLAYADHLVARELAHAAGADEGIRLDADGNLAECATANLFVVVGGVVVTAPADRGVLPGIVRGRVLRYCAHLGIPVAERALPRAELAHITEIFATSSLRGVVPITRLDGTAVACGPVTRRLAEAHTRAL